MSNFYELLSDVLNEKGKSFQDLEQEGVICLKSFYNFKTYTPFLQQILRISNYLKISLDYLTERSTTNKFKEYKLERIAFYNNLKKIMNNLHISQSKLSKDLDIGRSNFTYWKKGSLPKLNTLVSIADYLDCSIDDLLG